MSLRELAAREAGSVHPEAEHAVTLAARRYVAARGTLEAAHARVEVLTALDALAALRAGRARLW